MRNRHRPIDLSSAGGINIPGNEPKLVRLLILRTLFDLGCSSHLLKEHCFDHDGITTFNLDIVFFETYLLPALLEKDRPVNRMDFEVMQLELAEKGIDVRIFCDARMLESDQLKRTAIPIHPVLPNFLQREEMGNSSLFHPKVIFLEDSDGRMVLGTGSANLSVSGWGRNQEVFLFKTVSSNEQYQQIKRFFFPLAKSLGLLDEQQLGVRRKFYGEDESWRFVHSFEKTTFLEYLLQDVDAKRLTVWSPYFSTDMPELIERVSEVAGSQLSIEVVPDLVQGRHIRTLWNENLQALIDKGVLTFHDYPISRPDKIEMTHAKVWQVSARQSRLAIGSWNFTKRGSASFENRNVEAGILFPTTREMTIAGKSLNVTNKNFCDEKMFGDEELNPPEYPLPFELQVAFDWQEGCYRVTGRRIKEIDKNLYTLELPGIKKNYTLIWKKRKNDGAYPLEELDIPALVDNEELLANHTYMIKLNGQVIYRGLIHETGQTWRRALACESLKELLDSLVNDDDPESGGVGRLRKHLRGGDDAEPEDNVGAVMTAGDGMSYFRIFYAFNAFRNKLDKTQSMDDLNKWLFVYPGCLQVLAEKVREQVKSDGNTIFNWFLVQELNSLYSHARDCYDSHRERYARKTPTNKDKWATLKVKKNAVKLPEEIEKNFQYMRQLKMECGYDAL